MEELVARGRKLLGEAPRPAATVRPARAADAEDPFNETTGALDLKPLWARRKAGPLRRVRRVAARGRSGARADRGAGFAPAAAEPFPSALDLEAPAAAPAAADRPTISFAFDEPAPPAESKAPAPPAELAAWGPAPPAPGRPAETLEELAARERRR